MVHHNGIQYTYIIDTIYIYIYISINCISLSPRLSHVPCSLRTYPKNKIRIEDKTIYSEFSNPSWHGHFGRSIRHCFSSAEFTSVFCQKCSKCFGKKSYVDIFFFTIQLYFTNILWHYAFCILMQKLWLTLKKF